MGGQQGIAGMMLPLAMFAAIFYFMIIRPQKKKQKAHEEMLASISRGSMVVTAGGFFGIVREILDDSYIIELDDNTRVRILKSSISVKRDSADAEPKPRKKKKKIRKLTDETDQTEPKQEIPEGTEEPAAVTNEEAAFVEVQHQKTVEEIKKEDE